MKTLRLKSKLLLAFSTVAVVLGLSIAILGMYVINEDIYKQAQMQVRSDLKGVKAVLTEELKVIGVGLDLCNDDRLGLFADKLGLDYICKSGIGDDSAGPIAARALQGSSAGGFRVLSADKLAALVDEPAEKFRIEIVPTSKARPSDKKALEDVTVMEYARPITDPAGRVTGVLYGGRILNRDSDLINKLRDAVFENREYKGKPLGTVTLFQNDVRIATNVRNTNGQVAYGTRVSEEVYSRVIEEGRAWVDEAFVVTDWYLTAYEPLHDIAGKVIGIIYVGTLKEPFDVMARNLLLVFIAIVGGALALAFVLSVAESAVICRPLNHILSATHDMISGKMGGKVPADEPIAELNDLAHSFNRMSQELGERQQRLTEANCKLEEANKSYLDLIGFVAHELKGILASTTMNAYAIRDGFLGMVNFKQRRAMDSITRNLDYLAATVKKFLNLSRIEKGEIELHAGRINFRTDVVLMAYDNFERVIAERRMQLIDEVGDDIELDADVDLMQIVMNNLIGNATKYGVDGGVIRVTTRKLDGLLEVEVYNDSRPITEEQAAKLFKKFSRLDVPEKKKVKGTGLGLYITRQIVETHGGKIRVEPRRNGNSFLFQVERVL